MLVLSYYT